MIHADTLAEGEQVSLEVVMRDGTCVESELEGVDVQIHGETDVVDGRFTVTLTVRRIFYETDGGPKKVWTRPPEGTDSFNTPPTPDGEKFEMESGMAGVGRTKILSGDSQTDSTDQQRATGSTSGHSRASDDDSLDEIADELIGDETFEISQDDTESVVSKAKKKARNQGRDPAIDPKFQSEDE